MTVLPGEAPTMKRSESVPGIGRGRQHEVGEECHESSQDNRIKLVLSTLEALLAEEELRRLQESRSTTAQNAYRA